MNIYYNNMKDQHILDLYYSELAHIFSLLGEWEREYHSAWTYKEKDIGKCAGMIFKYREELYDRIHR